MRILSHAPEPPSVCAPLQTSRARAHCVSPAGPNTNVDIWGHHDVVAWGQGEPCNTQTADGRNAQPCGQWWPGKGPQWQRWGWQLSQTGSTPDTHAGPSSPLGTLLRLGLCAAYS